MEVDDNGEEVRELCFDACIRTSCDEELEMASDKMLAVLTDAVPRSSLRSGGIKKGSKFLTVSGS
jgi:hypothetical protein